jgi:L-ascorbate metabolism protein UlaG (beta-lactamase superfamily)
MEQTTTRRGHREGSIYQRKDGRWVAAIMLEPGKRTYYYGKTYQEVVQRLRAQQEQHEVLTIALACLPFQSYAPIEEDHESLDAIQIHYPFTLQGQQGKAGDYIVRGAGSIQIVDQAQFKASYMNIGDVQCDGAGI